MSLSKKDFQFFLRDIRPFLYRKSITYVDVGAYLGETFKDVLDSGIKIREAHLVEPNPISRMHLLRNIDGLFLGNILEVHPVALAENEGSVVIRPAKGMTKVLDSNVAHDDLGVNVVSVPCINLDGLSKTFNVSHLGLLKIDVEGYELEVLRGARDLLLSQKVDIIYLELGLDPNGTQQTYYRDVEDFLNSFDYKIFKFYEQTNEIHDDSPFLRRINAAFFSKKFAENNPYKLSLELFSSKKSEKSLRSEVSMLNSSFSDLKNKYDALCYEITVKSDAYESELLDLQAKLKLSKDSCDNLESEIVNLKVSNSRLLDKCVSRKKRLRKSIRLNSEILAEKNTLLRDISRIKSLYDKSNSKHKQYVSRVLEIKESLAYMLGLAIVSCLKSPKDWVKVPYRVVCAFKSYKAKKKIDLVKLDESKSSPADLIEKITLNKDVVIVTNLRFPGGNASSTLDEFRFFNKEGLDVALVNCPVRLGQKSVVSDRYDSCSDYIYDASCIERINARVVIIRHPRVMCSQAFSEIFLKIKSDKIVVVVNNSIYRPNGDLVYDTSEFLEVFYKLEAQEKLIYPLGPAIRRELVEGNVFPSEVISDIDWSPTFDAENYFFNPKSTMEYPLVIGRHGRDGAEKWIEDADLLQLVYPENASFTVKILGGADNAFKILNRIPFNWEVLPFGSVEPSKYLRTLDVFVYFPNSSLNEAFGRTIMEAVFSGVPCVLPRRFSETFGDLVFYCEPCDVESVLKRIASDNCKRVKFLECSRGKALSRFESGVLNARAGIQSPELSYDFKFESFEFDFLGYKLWVETGM